MKVAIIKYLASQANTSPDELSLDFLLSGLPLEPSKTVPDSSPSFLVNDSPCYVLSGLSKKTLDKDNSGSPQRSARSRIPFKLLDISQM